MGPQGQQAPNRLAPGPYGGQGRPFAGKDGSGLASGTPWGGGGPPASPNAIPSPEGAPQPQGPPAAPVSTVVARGWPGLRSQLQGNRAAHGAEPGGTQQHSGLPQAQSRQLGLPRGELQSGFPLAL